MKKSLLYFLLIFLCFSKADALCNKKLIAKVESYLGSFKNFHSEFMQTDKNQKKSHGNFEMRRPGYMKLEYDRPNIEIIYDNGKISFFDKELNSYKKQKIHNFILRAILDGKLQNRNLKCKAISEFDSHINVSLIAHYDVLNSSDLSLSFKKNNNKLLLYEMENRQKNDFNKITFYNVNMKS